MRRARKVVLLVALCAAGTARAGYLSGYVFLYPIESTAFSSRGTAQYHNDLGQPEGSVSLEGTHSVNGPQVFQTPVQGAGTYSGTLDGPAAPGACYGTTLHVVADPPGWFNTSEETFTGDSRCAPAPAGSDIDVTAERCEGLSGFGNPCSPILINIESGGFALSGDESPVAFDLNADGHRNRVTWTEAGSTVAFLARDRNGNGRVDDGSELFGDSTRLRSGARAPNGFEAVRELDTDGDGLVSANDPGWHELLLWTDASHDGISQPHELRALGTSSVRAIETSYHWSGRTDPAGNQFRYQGVARLAHGRRPIYDVYFRSVQ